MLSLFNTFKSVQIVTSFFFIYAGKRKINERLYFLNPHGYTIQWDTKNKYINGRYRRNRPNLNIFRIDWAMAILNSEKKFQQFGSADKNINNFIFMILSNFFFWMLADAKYMP